MATNGVSPDTQASIEAQRQLARDSAALSLATAQAAQAIAAGQQKTALVTSTAAGNTEMIKQAGNHFVRGASAG
jgi:hypothetical protein